MMTSLALFAVHISDGMLSEPFWLGGFVAAGLLLFWGSRQIRDEEIPRIAVLTAAFFLASLFHVRVGPTSAHLLLNALVGVILGRRAVLAIAVALFLQAMLIQHGGFTTLGINCCIMTVPALAASVAFRPLQRLSLVPTAGSVLVAMAVFIWLLSLVYSIALLVSNPPWAIEGALVVEQANSLVFDPLVVLPLVALSIAAGVLEKRFRSSDEFALGLLLGESTVLLTVALNCTVLILGMPEMTVAALLLVVFHLPIAFIEGAILGFTMGFLARVKPEMLNDCVSWLWQRKEIDRSMHEPSPSPIEAEKVAS